LLRRRADEVSCSEWESITVARPFMQPSSLTLAGSCRDTAACPISSRSKHQRRFFDRNHLRGPRSSQRLTKATLQPATRPQTAQCAPERFSRTTLLFELNLIPATINAGASSSFISLSRFMTYFALCCAVVAFCTTHTIRLASNIAVSVFPTVLRATPPRGA
jgi:hypothetical protein